MASHTWQQHLLDVREVLEPFRASALEMADVQVLLEEAENEVLRTCGEQEGINTNPEKTRAIWEMAARCGSSRCSSS